MENTASLVTKLLHSIIFILISTFYCNTLTAQPNGEGFVVGKTYRIQSKILNEERRIYVYLPAGYNQSEAKYPVAYLVDGSAHFHYTTGMVRALASANKIPQMIVIGILNMDRYSDFTPYPISYFPNSGNSEKFTRFIKEELFPFVEKYYRTESHRVLIGYSLGGLYSIYTSIYHPELFNSYIAGSPALLHIDSLITVSFSERLKLYPSVPRSLFFTIGGRESDAIKECTYRFRDILTANAPGTLKWTFNFMEKEDHSTQIFSSFYDGLAKIYADWEIPIDIADKGFEAIKDYYKNLSKVYGYDISLSANLINSVVKNLINLKNYESAINILSEAVVLFPNSPSLQNNLGVAYEKTNQLDLAKDSYDKASLLAGKNKDPYYDIYIENLNNILTLINNKGIRKNYEAQILED
ncbi:MAG: hypothetical protein A2V66_00510 [Ignavibacteria bacterium RBG_13_36_8]|nr:MAG: hypothetical protein A2V66_00510 [Ignavibacteria bacterium RBG_13_36_8]